MNNETLKKLVSCIDPVSMRVHVPSRVVFLCGGAISDADPPQPPMMLRDVYYRHRKADLESLPFRVVLAEEADPLTTEAGYNDLLSFESDIAQIVGLIVLFVESAGSFAELGAFSALETIAPNLLAVMLDHYYDQRSFIKNGPIKYLESKHGEDSVLSIEMLELGITEAVDIASVNSEVLCNALDGTIQYRLDKLSKWRAFDPQSDGHKILTMTGLCQEYGALTITELRWLLAELKVEVDLSRLKSYIYCAELMGWVRLTRKGHQKYVVALMSNSQERALDWAFKNDAPFKDRVRWRTDIRASWKKTDTYRYRAITEVENG